MSSRYPSGGFPEGLNMLGKTGDDADMVLDPFDATLVDETPKATVWPSVIAVRDYSSDHAPMSHARQPDPEKVQAIRDYYLGLHACEVVVPGVDLSGSANPDYFNPALRNVLGETHA